MAGNIPNPTPSSEIIHLVSTFADTIDALPPSLTRSLSDLKELDAVLSGSLQGITTKLQNLFTMMNNPPPGTTAPAGALTFTPFERLKLLREVTEDARIFRLGGEDKIRVATGTCETIATHTAHLSTLSTLLLTFLPSHLLPMLPPPSAPHGYSSSATPSSALARRQIFDYPPSQHAGAGSTSRMQGALGMVREHWDITRGGGRQPSGVSKRRVERDEHVHSRAMPMKEAKEKDPSQRHPNQYTKKKLQEQQAAASRSQVPVQQVEKEKRRPQQAEVARTTGTLYPGMASQEEYNAATLGGGRSTKRKGEDNGAARKRTKKGPDSPDPVPRTIPTPPVSSTLKPSARRTTSRIEEAPAPLPVALPLMEEDDGMDGVDGDEDGDGQTYCVCHRVSFGEMIGCDGTDCDREWFHLSCVGLQAIPKGRWFCDDCRKKSSDKAGKKRR